MQWYIIQRLRALSLSISQAWGEVCFQRESTRDSLGTSASGKPREVKSAKNWTGRWLYRSIQVPSVWKWGALRSYSHIGTWAIGEHRDQLRQRNTKCLSLTRPSLSLPRRRWEGHTDPGQNQWASPPLPVLGFHRTVAEWLLMLIVLMLCC